jgi:probable FeS assembly SUF system protein SufT
MDLPSEGALEDQVWSQLATCYDPEIPVNIVDLGLVYSCEINPIENSDEHRVEIKMTLTAPGCGMGDVIKSEVQEKILLLPGVGSAIVDLVFDPQWDRSMMSDEARLKTGLM